MVCFELFFVCLGFFVGFWGVFFYVVGAIIVYLGGLGVVCLFVSVGWVFLGIFVNVLIIIVIIIIIIIIMIIIIIIIIINAADDDDDDDDDDEIVRHVSVCISESRLTLKDTKTYRLPIEYFFVTWPR